MTLLQIFFTFLNALWVMAFIAIPFAVTYEEKENIPANEKYIAAPKSINWKKLLRIASSLAALFTLTLYVVIGMYR